MVAKEDVMGETVQTARDLYKSLKKHNTKNILNVHIAEK